MTAKKPTNVFILLIMVVITLFNAGLAVNFFAASGRALAGWLNNETVFLFAGIQLVMVLAAYIVYRHMATKKH
jgi:uncharacterized membrane protein